MRSGTLDTTSQQRACPAGYTKVCEGTAAVLFPPVAPRKSHAQPQSEQQSHSPQSPHSPDRTAAPASDEALAVFYNPAQVVNRDLSVCALVVYAQEQQQQQQLQQQRRRRQAQAQSATQASNASDGDGGITVLEALSATGLRTIRYYKEVPNIRYIIANDMDTDAVACIRRNCIYNNVPLLRPSLHANVATTAADNDNDDDDKTASRRGTSGVVANCDDANALMYRLATTLPSSSSSRMCLVTFAHDNNNTNNDKSTRCAADAQTVLQPLLQHEAMDVVDLDPYGAVSPFLDAALGVVKDGGLLLVTSTDSAVLCGNHVGTCHAKYTAAPYKRAHCHEMAVRVVLAAVARAASRRGRYIVPLLSLHIDFYVRCVVRVYTQPAEAKLLACKLGHYLQCTRCPAYWLRPVAVARAPRTTSSSRRQDRRRRQREHDDDDNDNDNNNNNNNNDKQQQQHVGNAALRSCATAAFATPPSRLHEPRLSCPTLAQTLPCAHAMPGEDDDDDGRRDGCPVCGAAVVLAGPLYAAATQSATYVRAMLDVVKARAASGCAFAAAARITGLLTTAAEELPDCPLYYEPQEMSSYVRVRCPATPCLVGALQRLGYRCSQVHCSASGVKTDCPPDVLMRVMLQWKATVTRDDDADAATTTTTTTTTRTQEHAQQRQQQQHRVVLTPHCQRPLTMANLAYDRQYDYRRPVTGVAKFVANAPGWGPRRRHRGALHVDEGGGDDDDNKAGTQQQQQQEEEAEAEEA